MLNTAVKAARRGATLINRASFDLDRVSITEKHFNDFVTEVDQAAEAAIIEVLKTAYPDHAILAEESGASANLHDQNDYVWIIDPLDGTTNFIHGFPQYCVSIALQHRGVITQAVVYDPTRNEMFTATKGAGAFLNEKRIRVTRCDKLADSLIGTGFPSRDLSALDQYLEMFKVMTGKCQGLRRPGSAALDLAYVATGRLDGFFEKGLAPWDIAAGSLLITEAGGIVGNFSGDADYLYKGDILAGTPKVFAQMVNVLQPFAAAPK
ncbi:inositol monophosphatase family protein [Undibacterium oligocarboniphilum]|uniref:Inositol-1-monophosphatase n=1 Tax=Undibacterium oligocarboniphilum TaxID=666702 RepID=A0A850QH12_9BURK|nr:inositol monophosphatase family protein [Undibacterium oligocarboniphilum]MBC3868683.1 inositol monophosphatase [Undibacterium oligocarboniphilum]NVO76663.1 inositol monophosphatase [Undibacterium oligocarboniphilum]